MGVLLAVWWRIGNEGLGLLRKMATRPPVGADGAIWGEYFGTVRGKRGGLANFYHIEGSWLPKEKQRGVVMENGKNGTPDLMVL